MTRRELIEALMHKTGFSKADAAAAVEGMLQAIEEALVRGESVELRRFGRFYPRRSKPRKARHIPKNQLLTLPARTNIAFRASRDLLTRVREHLDSNA